MGYAFETLKGTGYRLKGHAGQALPMGDRAPPRYRDRGAGDRLPGYQVDSTNALAFKLALAGCAEGTCVVAESQTPARGRIRGRWQSPPRQEPLCIRCAQAPGPSLPHLPLELHSRRWPPSIRSRAGVTPRLKWPNDVLISGRKMCGTLIELSTEADRVRFVVIGIGLNINMEACRHGPGDSRDTATSLLIETKKHFERASICGMLLNGLERYYEVARQQGMDEMCRLWEERARTKGTYMEIRQMDRVYRGISEGIDRDGAILLKENGVITRVIAGDVTV